MEFTKFLKMNYGSYPRELLRIYKITKTRMKSINGTFIQKFFHVTLIFFILFLPKDTLKGTVRHYFHKSTKSLVILIYF